MDTEFHYHITYLICLAAGFSANTAYKIAYSSQYVDDNCTKYTIYRHPKPVYENMISQTNNILLPIETLAKIYTCFHFLPGDDYDSPHKLKTTPANIIAKILLQEALKDCDPYWIGVAAHAFADTFAHQNFSGIFDENNAGCGFAESFIPNIGHADFGNKPDIINLIWHDHRFSKVQIRNKQRFLKAAQMLFYEFKIFINPKAKTPNIDAILFAHKLNKAIGKEQQLENNWFDNAKRQRIKRYHKLAKELSGMPIPAYDETAWLNQAAEEKNGALYFKDNYYKSHWCQFQAAVISHQHNAWKRIKDRVLTSLGSSAV